MNTLLVFLILLVGQTESVEPDTTFFDQNFTHARDSREDSVSKVNLEFTKYKHKNIISNSGIPMEEGQFEWKNIYLLFNQFGLGITDKFSATASFLIIPDLGIISDFEIAYLISTSYAIWQKENIYYLKVSGFLGKGPLPQFRQPGFFGFYASNTIGNPRNNFSFGIGYGKSFITKEYSYDTGGYLITSLGG
uniref:hypothetical protein n=1 Tax=Aquiflexum sp. TaxID=1872584 RepID=UPI003593787F